MASSHLTDIISDLGEVALDAITKNEVIREIPLLGTAVNIARVGASIRDKVFLSKIRRFIQNLPDITEDQKRKLIEESRKDKSRRAKIGESVFTALEQSDSTAKIDYISAVFEAFLNEEISDADLRMICFAIRQAFADDVIEFVESPSTPTMAQLKYLVAFGLSVSEVKKNTWDSEVDIEYTISDAGVKLRDAWKKHKLA